MRPKIIKIIALLVSILGICDFAAYAAGMNDKLDGSGQETSLLSIGLFGLAFFLWLIGFMWDKKLKEKQEKEV